MDLGDNLASYCSIADLDHHQCAGGAMRLFTSHEAADYLGVSTRTLAAARKSGQLNFYRLGRTIKYSENQLLEFLETCRNIPKQGRTLEDLAYLD